MNFFKHIILLIVSPKEGWKDIGKYSIPNSLLLAKVFYPCLALVAMSAFVPYLCGSANTSLQGSVINAMLDFVKYFIAFFASSAILSGKFADIFQQKSDVNKLNNLIVFCLTILALFNILRNVMPGFPFFEIFPLYIVYVVYRGSAYLEIPNEKNVPFVAISTVLFLAIPAILKLILDFFIPNA